MKKKTPPRCKPGPLLRSPAQLLCQHPSDHERRCTFTLKAILRLYNPIPLPTQRIDRIGQQDLKPIPLRDQSKVPPWSARSVPNIDALNGPRLPLCRESSMRPAASMNLNPKRQKSRLWYADGLIEVNPVPGRSVLKSQRSVELRQPRDHQKLAHKTFQRLNRKFCAVSRR